MEDLPAGTHHARSPTRARARVSRQEALVPAPSPTRARSADRDQSRHRDMAPRCRWIARVSSKQMSLFCTYLADWHVLPIFVDDHTPSRIPQRKPSTGSTASGTTPRPARLSVTTTTTPGSRLNGTSTITRKTASGSASPAPTR